ncbi:MAG TPA: L-aspartate oxidase [Ilumatobacteraceae bacterium]|nr:L-aspartate oxidase [Ilumatobacteraceae bacterium]
MIPRRLAAPPPTWERDVDVVVLGSGAAGLAAALAVRPVRSVLIVTKDVLNAGSTAWAQGGLAGVLDPTDSFEEHVRDTLAAGAGLCDEAVVRELVAEAPTSIRYLMRLGAAFDPGADGAGPALTREGGHSRNRIVHAGGDRSGAEVQRTLDESALAAGVDVLERAFALDLVTGVGTGGRQAAGITVATLGAGGAVESVGVVTARAVVLATGGYGQIFASTSNPPAVTGDGAAIALRAGLAVRDVEFVQFHPTVMWRGADATGQQPLVSEAVRGEGAILYDAAGERVMAGVHPLEDLAPRDVVAAAISRRMAAAPGGVDDHVYLDATSMGTRFYDRFPSITEACREIGIDPAVDRIPVAPAAHFACGGVPARLDGTTSLPGLFAVGEVACTGVHGANRLASNSLTEGVVTGTRLGRDLAWEVPDRVDVVLDDVPGGVLDAAFRTDIRGAMSRHVGVVRDDVTLAAATDVLTAVAGKVDGTGTPTREAWEATNALTVAAGVVAAATTRTESRGCHRRADFPEPRDEWRRHLDVALGGDGVEVRS